LLIIPGLYLAARLGLALPACVLDDQRAIESLKTSWSVAEGNLLKIGGLIGVLLLGFLVVGIASLVIALPITVVLGVTAGSTLASLVTAPIFGILLGAFQMALARVYLENRQPEPQRQQAGGYRQEQTQY
jgi:membrane-anchored glycerophosphoryl diester phosphodiesterase (GDPDase)